MICCDVIMMDEWYIADIEYDKEEFKDNVQLGILIHRLIQERKLTNTLLKSIEERLAALESRPAQEETKFPKVLSERDQQIVDYILKHGKANANEIMHAFGYKKQNGASARLNKLCKEGVLEKIRSGKQVFFYLKPS